MFECAGIGRQLFLGEAFRGRLRLLGKTNGRFGQYIRGSDGSPLRACEAHSLGGEESY